LRSMSEERVHRVTELVRQGAHLRHRWRVIEKEEGEEETSQVCQNEVIDARPCFYLGTTSMVSCGYR
jgi:hypothetical protein